MKFKQIQYEQYLRSQYLNTKITTFLRSGIYDLYEVDCCSFGSIIPYLLKNYRPKLSSIYWNYKKSKDFYKQVNRIKLKDIEDDKWNNRRKQV